MLLSMGEICDYASASPTSRNFIGGESLLHAGHILFCGKRANESSNPNPNPNLKITAFCIQTSNVKGKPHEISGIISNDGKILSMECSCKAGLSGKCKHVLGVLLYCARYDLDKLETISCTDTTCLWKAPREASLDKYKPGPLIEHECFQKKENRLAKKDLILSAEDEDIVKNLLIRHSSSSALAKHACGRHAPIYKVNSCPTLTSENQSEAIIGHQNSVLMENLSRIPFRPLRQCCDKVLENLNGDYVSLCQETYESVASWNRERLLRITGSRCYSLFTYSRNKNPNWQERSLKYFHPKPFSSQSTAQGILSEADARRKYESVQSVTVNQCGLVISINNPWLAYSPDGIVFEDNKPSRLLEIKCPVAGKKATAAEILPGTKFLTMSEGKFTLRKKHAYYGQIQMGMALLNLQETDLVIYAPFDDSIEIIPIPFDENFAKDMLYSLKRVYFDCMVHNLCEGESVLEENNNV